MPEWIVGRNPVYETLKARRRKFLQLQVADGSDKRGKLGDIIRLCRSQGVQVESVRREQLDRLGEKHQGVALHVSGYRYRTLEEILDIAAKRGEQSFILMLDALKDPQNLGSLLRTAEGFGVHGVCLPLKRTASVSPAVVNASSGACEHLFITQINLSQAIRRLKEKGVWVIGLEHGAQSLLPHQVSLDVPIALVVGSEESGLRPLIQKSCDVLMQIPMRGRVDSLNAAVAGSIALYLVWQARGFSIEQNH